MTTEEFVAICGLKLAVEEVTPHDHLYLEYGIYPSVTLLLWMSRNGREFTDVVSLRNYERLSAIEVLDMFADYLVVYEGTRDYEAWKVEMRMSVGGIPARIAMSEDSKRAQFNMAAQMSQKWRRFFGEWYDMLLWEVKH